MKVFLRATAVVFLAAIAAALWLWHEASSFLGTPPQEPGNDIYVDIQPGASLKQIAKDLAAKGVITDARKFIWLARYKNLGASAQAGRFLLNTGWTPEHVLDALANGRPVLYKVTIPEGLTWWQTGKLLQDAGLVRFEDFRDIISNADFLRHHGIPFASAEGFLMPDTYLMPKPDKAMPAPGSADAAGKEATEEDRAASAQWQAQARSVASRLIDNFWRKGTPLWAPDAEAGTVVRPDPENLKKWVVLASIVEKETGLPSERARVAGVYANRLAKNMLLQADPTVIYGLGPGFSGRLRRIDLDDAANPYNTYQRPGLPPGPISSFGMAALKAAINPEKHNYLFFVASGEGDAHTFTRNFDEHSEAVREYRRKQGR